MKVLVTITREFWMAEERVLAEPGFDPPPSDATPYQRRIWLEESFYELCGIDRGQDHLDGSFVQLRSDAVDVDFDWPEALVKLYAGTR